MIKWRPEIYHARGNLNVEDYVREVTKRGIVSVFGNFRAKFANGV